VRPRAESPSPLGRAALLKLLSDLVAIGKMHGEQPLERRQSAARRRCTAAVAFELFDDLALARDAFVGADDVPFDLRQVL